MTLEEAKAYIQQAETYRTLHAGDGNHSGRNFTPVWQKFPDET